MSPQPAPRGAVLAVLCAMALMIVLDGTIVAVALPDIQRDLEFSPAGVAWVVNGYLVAFAGLLLLSGRLGDLFGARRVFLAGLALFTAASALCGLAGTAGLLVAGRFVQGAGGALASAVILGTIVRIFPEPGPQAWAMGVYSFTQAAGSTIGFVVGGVLTDAAGWPAVFGINLPIGLIVLVAGLRLLPRESGPGRRGGLDVAGAVLVTAGLSLGVYGIVGPSWPSAVVALLLLAGFLVRQRQAAHPLIPLRVLTRPWLLRSGAAVVLIFGAGMGFQVLGALFLQRVMGLDALSTGLAFLPVPVLIGVVSLFVAPRLTGRFGPRPVLLGGLVLLGAGLLLVSRAPVDPSYAAEVLPGLMVLGLGVGVVVPAVIVLSMAGAPAGDTGLVSGFTNTAQQAGGALGIAVVAAAAAALTDAHRATGADPVSALRDGYSLGFVVAAGFVAAALVIAAVLLRRPPTLVNEPLTDLGSADEGTTGRIAEPRGIAHHG